MKNKKEFLGILFSVLICVFLVSVIVYATTTIGDPITVGTDLTVTSGARIGTGTSPGHITALADDSLLIEGDLEVDGSVYFDGVVSISMGDSLRTPYIYGGLDAGGYLSVGDAAATGHSLASEDDLLVTGKLEVDGAAYFDSTTIDAVRASVSDSLTVTDTFKVGGTASSSSLILDNGITFTTGVASPSGACGTAGSLFTETGTGIFSVCGTDGAWNPK